MEIPKGVLLGTLEVNKAMRIYGYIAALAFLGISSALADPPFVFPDAVETTRNIYTWVFMVPFLGCILFREKLGKWALPGIGVTGVALTVPVILWAELADIGLWDALAHVGGIAIIATLVVDATRRIKPDYTVIAWPILLLLFSFTPVGILVRGGVHGYAAGAFIAQSFIAAVAAGACASIIQRKWCGESV